MLLCGEFFQVPANFLATLGDVGAGNAPLLLQRTLLSCGSIHA